MGGHRVGVGGGLVVAGVIRTWDYIHAERLCSAAADNGIANLEI